MLPLPPIVPYALLDLVPLETRQAVLSVLLVTTHMLTHAFNAMLEHILQQMLPDVLTALLDISHSPEAPLVLSVTSVPLKLITSVHHAHPELTLMFKV